LTEKLFVFRIISNRDKSVEEGRLTTRASIHRESRSQPIPRCNHFDGRTAPWLTVNGPHASLIRHCGKQPTLWFTV